MEEALNASGISPLLFVIYLWSLPWKGVALWKSADKKHLKWFIALLFINTAGLLDALYIFYFSKRGEKKKKQSSVS